MINILTLMMVGCDLHQIRTNKLIKWTMKNKQKWQSLWLRFTDATLKTTDIENPFWMK